MDCETTSLSRSKLFIFPSPSIITNCCSVFSLGAYSLLLNIVFISTYQTMVITPSLGDLWSLVKRDAYGSFVMTGVRH